MEKRIYTLMVKHNRMLQFMMAILMMIGSVHIESGAGVGMSLVWTLCIVVERFTTVLDFDYSVGL